jgi:hypothetical protein
LYSKWWINEYICTFIKKLLIHLTHDISPLIKLLFNTLKSTRSLDALLGMHYYLRMLEGLRNVGPTFCRLMKAALKDQVGRNVLSYVDNIVVALKKKASYIFNLTETFTNMHEAKLKLNPDKCVFGVTRGKVLGCLVSTKGIKTSPDKIKTILQMQSPQTKKEVQILTGHIAALNRFIAKLAERSLPF